MVSSFPDGCCRFFQSFKFFETKISTPQNKKKQPCQNLLIKQWTYDFSFFNIKSINLKLLFKINSFFCCFEQFIQHCNRKWNASTQQGPFKGISQIGVRTPFLKPTGLLSEDHWVQNQYLGFISKELRNKLRKPKFLLTEFNIL